MVGVGLVAAGNLRVAVGSGSGEDVAAGSVGKAVICGVTLPAGKIISFCPS